VIRLYRDQSSLLLVLGEQPLQELWGRLVVGVEKNQNIHPAGLHTVVKSPGLAAPAFGKRRWLNHLDRKRVSALAGDGGGTVAGVIVDHDHFSGPENLVAEGRQ